ncbi:hypothetical protein N0V93_001964 [Gnomoniopsis smithogilvyi]|uniref:Uncharacterized protein n=1 Tax=Gnomoniopsis smithogilvyi TaxID=1191159 RepID=A0A9W9D2P5_9PEZI|nr:hypothetical protein N0V93_001964 [Gnomoniopsis smithogilvyi]
MSAIRSSLSRARPAAVSRYATTTLRPSGLWQAQFPVVQGQQAHYAIPPHDKKNDDLGGPYGQEPPNPEHRKQQNRGFAFQAAVVIGLGLGLVVTAGSFFSPRKIANYQIENDTVIGGPKSNTGGSLAAVKRKEGVKTSHELHQEQTGSPVLGTR